MENKNEEEKEEKKCDEVDFDSAIDNFDEETDNFVMHNFLEKSY